MLLFGPFLVSFAHHKNHSPHTITVILASWPAPTTTSFFHISFYDFFLRSISWHWSKDDSFWIGWKLSWLLLRVPYRSYDGYPDRKHTTMPPDANAPKRPLCWKNSTKAIQITGRLGSLLPLANGTRTGLLTLAHTKSHTLREGDPNRSPVTIFFCYFFVAFLKFAVCCTTDGLRLLTTDAPAACWLFTVIELK